MARVERALAAEPGPRLAIGGGVAANRRLRERAEGLGVEVKVPPPRAVHRQRGDDRAPPPAGWSRVPFPDYLALDAYATRPAAAPP